MNASDNSIEHIFNGLRFTKAAFEICEKAKIAKLKSKIEERQKRVADLRHEYQIDDAALVQLLTAARKQANAGVQRFSYSTPRAAVGGAGALEEKTIGAGVVNNLLTENDFIETERDNIKRLETIARNLRDIPRFAADGSKVPAEGFVLTYTELDFLEF